MRVFVRGGFAGFGPSISSRRHGGISLVWMGFCLLALIGIVSLAVDMGRVRLAREQLQTAADAGARGGAHQLGTSYQAAFDGAVDAADENPCIDQAAGGGRTDPGVVLDPTQDVEIGLWDTKANTWTPVDQLPNN